MLETWMTGPPHPDACSSAVVGQFPGLAANKNAIPSPRQSRNSLQGVKQLRRLLGSGLYSREPTLLVLEKTAENCCFDLGPFWSKLESGAGYCSLSIVIFLVV